MMIDRKVLNKAYSDIFNFILKRKHLIRDGSGVWHGMDVLKEYLTPKKPELQGDGFDAHGNIIYDTWICPNCEKYYEVDYDDYDHCPNCGQALDMSVIRNVQDE